MVQEPSAVNSGAPVDDFAVVAEFEFCTVTAFGIELVVAAFVCVGGKMRTLVVELFDGRGASGSENVEREEFAWGDALREFGCDGP